MLYPSVVNLPYIAGDSFVRDACSSAHRNSIFTWVFFGRLPVNKSITPSYANQILNAGALNRYISQVTVSRIPVVLSTVNLAVAATATYTFSKATAVVSADPAIATATIANGVVTITGVAAGTTTVTVSDVSGNTIATITVTVA